MKVVIRTMEQIDAMGETGKALKEIAVHQLFKPSYPLIYQYSKGIPGESVTHDEKDKIGYVTDVQLTSEGLVGYVTITIPAANSIHFDGTIDNFVVSKTFGDISKPFGEKGNTFYDLIHFVVYNKQVKEDYKKKQEMNKSVTKLYNAPTEMDINATDGDVLSKNIKSWNQTLQEVKDEYGKL